MNNDASIDILLIEDDQLAAELACIALKKVDPTITVLHIDNGEDALDYIFGREKYIDRPPFAPKLILLDLSMPKISGIQVLEILKADGTSRRFPVVILSSSKETKDVSACYDIGANGYVRKPIDFNEFRETMTNLCTFWLKINYTSQLAYFERVVR